MLKEFLPPKFDSHNPIYINKNNSNFEFKSFEKFARIAFFNAKISLDSFIDQQTEFDLIGESIHLYDARFDKNKDVLESNKFTTIISSINTYKTYK